MSPELWVSLAAVFISGGAIGSAGTLLAQWILRKVDGAPAARDEVEVAELRALGAEVAELNRHMHDLGARMDFTERLLDGALPSAPPQRTADDEA